MTRRTATPSRLVPANRPVARLAPSDSFRVNPEPLLRLQAALGAQATAEALRAAQEDLVHRLDRVAGAHRDGRCADLRREAAAIADAGRAMGLGDLALSAENVMDCTTRPDDAALGATVARLLRMGSLALGHFGVLRRGPGRSG